MVQLDLALRAAEGRQMGKSTEKARRRAAPQGAASRPAPGPREQRSIKAAIDWLGAEGAVPPEIRWSASGAVEGVHADNTGAVARLHRTLGTRSHDFMTAALGQLEHVTRRRGEGRSTSATELNAGLAVVAAIAPENELEAAMAVQMAGAHVLACELWGRARGTDRTDHVQLYGAMAVKASRTFATLAESLAKLRSGGKQQVEVRYVYVDARSVQHHTHAGGGGVAAETAAQPHAQGLEHQPGASIPPVWSADEVRCAVPGSRNPEPTPLPDARRAKPGRPPGPG